jgi:hypothetical protein
LAARGRFELALIGLFAVACVRILAAGRDKFGAVFLVLFGAAVTSVALVVRTGELHAPLKGLGLWLAAGGVAVTAGAVLWRWFRRSRGR